ncbi:MAG TPA: PilZ domain-containing protein [Acidimicrobiales bacterium]|nr:PilZ domain-containing protein [Acidimicrobiales bacterium]
MVTPETSQTPGGSAIGRHLTLRSDASPSGTACVIVGADSRSLTVKPMRPGPPPPHLHAGAEVRCTSMAGEWATTVRSVGDATIELAAPRWLSRAAHRRFARVRADQSTSLTLDGTSWAARLQDISLGGAAALVERAAELRPDQRVAVEINGGVATATVRSVRDHAHPLLVVAGLSWLRLDPDARSWIASHVARPPDAAG